jgi:hypothetical protein
VALQYSGAAEGRPLPMVLEMVVGPVDRGACIRDLSQYPKEVEYLYPPMSFLSPDGAPRLTVGAGGLGVRVVPVRVNVNLSARTVEQILGQKRRTHLAAFRFLAGELAGELALLAEDRGAAARLARDGSRGQGGVQRTVEGLLGGIAGQFAAVLGRHEAVGEGAYADDAVFQGLVADMLDARRWAVSKLRVWLEDETEYVCFAADYPLRDAHRRLTAYLARAAGAAGLEEGARRAATLEVCRARGLLRARVDEANDAGEAPLAAAAADGAAAADVRLLVAAGAAVNGAAGEPSAAATKAATYGHAEALGALLEARAAVNAAEQVPGEPSPAPGGSGRALPAGRPSVKGGGCFGLLWVGGGMGRALGGASRGCRAADARIRSVRCGVRLPFARGPWCVPADSWAHTPSDARARTSVAAQRRAAWRFVR